MNILRHLGPKTLVATLIAATVAGWCAWLILPLSPRATIPQRDELGRISFSHDCRFLACGKLDKDTPRSWDGSLKIWDTDAPKILFAIPYQEIYPPVMNGGYSMAFTRDASKFVTYGWGSAKIYEVPTGKQWQPAVAPEFPAAQLGKSTPSWLTTDARGDLFVYVRNWGNSQRSVYDFWTGKELVEWNGNLFDELFSGGVLQPDVDGVVAREIPSGKMQARLAHLPMKMAFGSPRQVSRVATPDCRTLVEIDGTVRASVNGEEILLGVPAHQLPAVSPDGRLLAALVRSASDDGNWLAMLMSKLGLRHSDSSFAVYDLTTGRRLARLPNANMAHFSTDGATLAIVKENSIELYDTTLNSPWHWIAGISATAACAVFLVGQWLRKRAPRRTTVQKPV